MSDPVNGKEAFLETMAKWRDSLPRDSTTNVINLDYTLANDIEEAINELDKSIKGRDTMNKLVNESIPAAINKLEKVLNPTSEKRIRYLIPFGSDKPSPKTKEEFHATLNGLLEKKSWFSGYDNVSLGSLLVLYRNVLLNDYVVDMIITLDKDKWPNLTNLFAVYSMEGNRLRKRGFLPAPTEGLPPAPTGGASRRRKR